MPAQMSSVAEGLTVVNWIFQWSHYFWLYCTIFFLLYRYKFTLFRIQISYYEDNQKLNFICLHAYFILLSVKFLSKIKIIEKQKKINLMQIYPWKDMDMNV